MQQNEEPVLDDTESNDGPINFPYKISFPDFEPSAATTADIERYIAKLQRFSDRIVSCNVQVRTNKLKSRTRNYHIHLQVNVPGDPIVVTREPETKDHDHANIHIAVRDAFNIAERQLRKIHSRQSKHGRQQDPVTARIDAEAMLDTVTDKLAANRVDNLEAKPIVQSQA